MAHSPAQATPGFTLIEILIVIVVIMILASMGIAAWTGVAAQARRSATRVAVLAVATAIERQDRRQIVGGSGATTQLFPAWDLNGDGFVDGDPARHGTKPLQPGIPEFTPAEITIAEGAAYHGLANESQGLSLAPRHLDADGHILDAWRRPLRIQWATPSQARFAGKIVGVWSMGKDGIDDAGANDDITSWN